MGSTWIKVGDIWLNVVSYLVCYPLLSRYSTWINGCWDNWSGIVFICVTALVLPMFEKMMIIKAKVNYSAQGVKYGGFMQISVWELSHYRKPHSYMKIFQLINVTIF